MKCFGEFRFDTPQRTAAIAALARRRFDAGSFIPRADTSITGLSLSAIGRVIETLSLFLCCTSGDFNLILISVGHRFSRECVGAFTVAGISCNTDRKIKAVFP